MVSDDVREIMACLIGTLVFTLSDMKSHWSIVSRVRLSNRITLDAMLRSDSVEARAEAGSLVKQMWQ